MATEPVMTELSVNYSAGTKVNIGNYESMDVHVSRTERWNVEGFSPVEVDDFFTARYEKLQAEVAELVVAKRDAILGGEL